MERGLVPRGQMCRSPCLVERGTAIDQIAAPPLTQCLQASELLDEKMIGVKEVDPLGRCPPWA